jgi:tetratricopeptide (TPR) repeat protein
MSYDELKSKGSSMLKALIMKNGILVAVWLGILVACGGALDSNKRLVETGNKYFAAGKLKEASIIYRKAIQKDALYGEAYYRLGITEMKRRNIGNAIRVLRRACELQPENDDAHTKLADMYLAIYMADKEKYKTMLGDFEEIAGKILKRDPNSFTGHRLLGYSSVVAANYKAAEDHFIKALAAKPGDPAVTLAIAQIYARTSRAPEAEKIMLAVVDKQKDYLAGYDFLYLLKIQAKKYDEGAEVLKRKAANNPKNAMTMVELALHQFRSKKNEEANQVLERLASDKANYPDGRAIAGDFYQRAGMIEAATRIFTEGITTDLPRKATYQKKLAELLTLQGRRDEAFKMIEDVLAANNNDPEAKALRAGLQLQSGKMEDVDKAIAEMESVLSKMPNNPVVRFNLGEAYLNKRIVDKALSQFQEALKINPGYVPAKNGMARILMMRKEFAKAQQLAGDVLKSAPRNQQAILLRAAATMNLGDREAARKQLQDVLKANPALRDARSLLAQLDLTDKRLAEAEESYRALMSFNPPDIRGVLGLAEVHMAAGRAPQAMALLEESARNNPNVPVYRMAVANLFVRTNQYPKAIERFAALTQEFPNRADLHMRLAESYRRGGNTQEAYKHFETASKISPRDSMPLIQMVAILEAMGDKEKGLAIYQKILEVSPDNPVALNNLAYNLAESGRDLDQALTYAQKAKQKMPTNLDISDTLGWIYIKKNLSDDAIKIFRDLVRQRPDHVTWRYHLALALFQKGDKLEAKKELQTAIQNKPSSAEGKKIQELLSRIG